MLFACFLLKIALAYTLLQLNWFFIGYWILNQGWIFIWALFYFIPIPLLGVIFIGQSALLLCSFSCVAHLYF